MLLSLRIHIFFNYLYFKSLSMYLIYLSIFSVIKIIIVNQDGPSKRPASINMNMLINSAEKNIIFNIFATKLRRFCDIIFAY